MKRVGILTSGGDCQGLNATIRAVAKTLYNQLGNDVEIIGIIDGYRGLIYGETRKMKPENFSGILTMGGTILGTSRQPFKLMRVVDENSVDKVEAMKKNYKKLGLDCLVILGGNGTQKTANLLREEGLNVVSLPKTIDNDLSFIDTSFGFDTAVASAVPAVRGAHVEAKSAYNGIGLVKVMGRESGFIAAHTSLAQSDVNFCLIPENPFDLDGPNGLLHHLEKRILDRGHAVILVAEGAGTDLVPPTGEVDAGGNIKYQDIGVFLKEKIKEYFKEKNIPVSIKYIDPSYIIRSTPANSYDSIYCARLGAHAVHAAMAGKTQCIASSVNNRFVYIPIKAAVAKRNHVNPEGALWRDVLENTRQPVSMKN